MTHEEEVAQLWAFRTPDANPRLLGRYTQEDAIAKVEELMTAGDTYAVEAWRPMGDVFADEVKFLRATRFTATGPWAPSNWVPACAVVYRTMERILSEPRTVTHVREMLITRKVVASMSRTTVRRYLETIGAKHVGWSGNAKLWGFSDE